MMTKPSLFLILLLICICSWICTSALNIVPQDSVIESPNLTPIEYNSLYDFYVALKGQNWIYGPTEVQWNYNQPNPNPCAENWYGVTCSCNITYCHLDTLELDRHNLTGPLLPSIGNFMNLSILLLHNNYITGSIPEEIGNLPTLSNFTLRFNYLTGNLPMSVWNMTQLIAIDLQANFLEGTLPDAIGQLTNLIWFNIQDNLFSGTIPSSIQNIKSLESLKLSINSFNGTIPLALTTFPRLKNLFLMFNHFSSSVPSEIANLKTLRLMELAGNHFTGLLPESIGQMPNLNYFGTLWNDFFGPIPSGFSSNLTDLVVLSLAENLFSQNIPETLSLIPHLVVLFVARNSLSGPIPANFSRNFDHLEVLGMNVNFFSQSIPETFFNFNSTYSILLDQNSLSGSLPPFLHSHLLSTLTINENYLTGSLSTTFYDGLVNMKSLQIYNNYFTSTISPSLNKFQQLKFFFAHTNLFTGPIQFTLQGFPALTELFLFHNFFTGNLNYLVEGTKEVQLASVLRVLDVSQNSFTGTIPPSLFTNYEKLNEFVSSINCFHGRIPDEICASNLTVIEMDGLSSASACRIEIFDSIPSFTAFYLQYYMSGSIPSCLFAQPDLISLHMSGNGFTGSLPSFELISTLTDLAISHNFITGTLPKNFQEQLWTSFDVSYNKLTGLLDGNAFNNVPSNTTIYFEENRFSGDIPHALLSGKDVDILSGNMWTCNYEQSNLPKDDPNAGIYECGSDSVNQSFLIYFVLISGGVLLVMITELSKRAILYRINSQASDLPGCNNDDLPKSESPVERPSSLVFIPNYWSVVREIPNYSSLPVLHRLFIAFSDCKKTFFSILFSPIEKEEDANIRSIVRLMINIRQSLLKCLFVILVILTPIYLGLSFHYSNYSKRYIWLFSSIFLSGKEAGASLILCFVLIYIAVSMVFYRHLRFNIGLLDSSRKNSGDLGRLSSVSAYRGKRRFESIYYYFKGIWRYLNSLRFKGLVIIFLINFFVMIIIDAGYVYIAINYSSQIVTLTELSLSLFRIFWNEIALWKMIDILKEYTNSKLHEEGLASAENREDAVANPSKIISEVKRVQRSPKVSRKSIKYGESMIATADVSFFRKSDLGYPSSSTQSTSTIQPPSITIPDYRASDLDRGSLANNYDVSKINPVSLLHDDIPITREMILENEKDLIFLVYLLLFNNIFIPGLASSIISQRCFYNALFAAPDVSSYYEYYQCATIATIEVVEIHQCRKYGFNERTITYTPPFSYSFECTSVMVSRFAAVYVYMALFAGIIIPSIRLLLAAVYRYYHFNSPDTFHGSFWDEVLLQGLTMPLIPVDLLLQATSGEVTVNVDSPSSPINKEEEGSPTSEHVTSNRDITPINNPIHGFNRYIIENKEKPKTPESESTSGLSEKSIISSNQSAVSRGSSGSGSTRRKKLPTFDGTLFNREKFIVKVTNYLAILITFGVVFPLLAVLLFVSIMLLTYYEQVVLTNFILNLKKLFWIRYSNAFRLHSKYIQHCFNRSLWILLSFATFIYAFSLFDTVGDVYGWRVGLGVSMGLVGWYLVIWLGFDWMWRNVLERWFHPEKQVDDRRNGSMTSDGGISLASVDSENPA